MNNKERSYIKYKPSLQYKSPILSVVERGEEGFNPSPSLQRLLERTPSGVLGEISDTIEDNKVLQKRLEKCLENDVIGGISFSDYAKNLKDKEGDKELVRDFEKQNANSLFGSTQAEVYPMLVEMEEELTTLGDFINQTFYSGGIDMDFLHVAEEKDKSNIDNLISMESSGAMSQLDVGKLQTQDVALEISAKRIDNCKNMQKSINAVLCSTVNTYYNGNIGEIVKAFGNADISVLESMNACNTVSFNRSVMESNNDILRNARSNTPSMKSSMLELFSKVSKIKDDDCSKMLQYALSIDTDSDQSVLTQIVSDMFDSIEFAQDEFQKVTLEVFKQVKSDQLVKNDIVNTVQAKRFERQKSKLISDIITEKKSGTFDAESFISDRSLEAPGTLCSR